MHELLALDDPRAARRTGSKAAGLARAMRAGSPVLAGWVVPAAALEPLWRAGAEALETGSPAAAQLAVSGCRPAPDVIAAVRAVCAGFTHGAVIRSSTPLDGDPAFSGAFATYHEVGLDDVETAVVGCVASSFTREALERYAAAGITLADVDLEVLVQPWMPFDAGGIATVEADGGVRIVSVDGSPAALMGGRRTGVVSTVGPGGELRHEAPTDPAGAECLRTVARTAREVLAALGDGSIEWGVHASIVSLLQVRRAPARPRTIPEAVPVRHVSALEERMARLAVRFPGPLGEAEVMPWAVALDRIPDAPALDVGDPSSAAREAVEIAAELRAHVWGFDTDDRAWRWAEVSRSVLAGEADAVTPVIDALRPPDPAAATRLLGLWRGVGVSLAAAGVLAHPAQVWRMTPDRLRTALEGPGGARHQIAHGADRWEMFVAAVVASAGVVSTGETVAPGLGAGRLHRLVAGATRPGPRAVLVAQRPVPQIAPLLWGCAGLVTVDGSEGAHLFEVARSLGVPAVTSPDFGERGVPPSGALVAVDGYTGSIAVLSEVPGFDDRLEIGA